MKKTTALIMIMCMAFLSGCATYQLNGVPLDKFQHATTEQWAKMAAGMVASGVTHWAGHVLYLEMNGIEWHQSGVCEWVDEPTSDGKLSALGRAGFVSQLSVGLILDVLDTDEFFLTGYHAGSLLEVVSYPLTGNGDLELIDRAGNARLEWVGYTAASVALLAR